VSVVAIIGTGGMGLACARRLGSGRRLVVGDHDRDRLAEVVAVLGEEGHDALDQPVDVVDPFSVQAFAARAVAEGPLAAVVHTAGLSPTMASGDAVLRVDLVGTAHVLDAFVPHVTDGTVVVCIASMAGHMWPMDAATEVRMAHLPAAELVEAAALGDSPDPGLAYAFAKRANLARVKGMAAAYGARGARVVSVSPGMISTGMGRQEFEQQPVMAEMLASSPLRRLGTPDDIAAAVEWLVSPAAGFVTGTDLLVDGGVVAANTVRDPAAG